MKFTGTLGNPASMPGHLVLGLATKLSENVSQSLSLTQSILLDFPHFYADVLTLTQHIDAAAVKNQVDRLNLVQYIDYELGGAPTSQSQYCVHSDLNLVETITYSIVHVHYEVIADRLNLTEPCITIINDHIGRIIFRSITDHLNLTQNLTGTVSVTHTETVTDNLNLTQSVTSTLGNILSESLTDNITLTQSFFNNYDNEFTDDLNLTETLTYTFGTIYNESVNHTLSFTEDITDLRVPGGNYLVNDSLSLTDTITSYVVHNQQIIDTLSLGDDFNKFAQNRQVIRQKLVLTDNIHLGTVINFSLTDNLVFKDFYEIPLNFNNKIHVSIINAILIPATARSQNFGNQVNPSLVRYNNVPAGKFKNFITLRGGSGASITLPPPLFGDSYGLDNQVKIGRSMKGTVYSYVSTSKFIKITYTFSLSRNKVLELISFYSKSCASQIYLTDWNYNYYSGFIMTEPFSTSQNRAYDNQVELSFQVMKII